MTERVEHIRQLLIDLVARHDAEGQPPPPGMAAIVAVLEAMPEATIQERSDAALDALLGEAERSAQQ